VARDELPAAVASITAVLQTFSAADHEPIQWLLDVAEPEQHTKPTYKVHHGSRDEISDAPQIEARCETPLDQEHSEVTPDTYNEVPIELSSVDDEPTLRTPVERIYRTDTAPSGGSRLGSFEPASIPVSVPSSSSYIAEDVPELRVLSRTASFSSTLSVQLTSTMPPSQLRQEPSSPPPFADDVLEKPIPLRIVLPRSTFETRRISTVVPSGRRQDLHRLASQPTADDAEEQPVLSRATLCQPALETRRANTLTVNTRWQASVMLTSSPVAGSLLEQPTLLRVASRQPTQRFYRASTASPIMRRQASTIRTLSPAGEDSLRQPVLPRVAALQPTQGASRTSTAPSDAQRNDSPRPEKCPILSLAADEVPDLVFPRLDTRQSTPEVRRTSTGPVTRPVIRLDLLPARKGSLAQPIISRVASRQPIRQEPIREAEIDRMLPSELPSDAEDVFEQGVLSRSISPQPTRMVNILAIPESELHPTRKEEDARSEPSIATEVLPRFFERQKIIQRGVMPNEQLILVGRTSTTRLPLRTESLRYQSHRNNNEELIGEYAESKRSGDLAPTKIIGRKDDTDQFGGSSTSTIASDPETFALRAYQRVDNEPLGEDYEPSVIGSTNISRLDERADPFEKTSDTQSSPALEPLVRNDAQSPLNKTT
jgi:hypothetical protein